MTNTIPENTEELSKGGTRVLASLTEIEPEGFGETATANNPS
ncbi:MAG TPA: hypothetical protein VGR92_17330 [Steroidobacteraceae bacterium]|nr:hypothetical protein [Steroidobacteraceae bacterium]